MTKLFKSIAVLVGLMLGASMLPAQTILPQTTLAAAVTSQSTTTVSLTSVSGVVGTSTVIYVADGFGEAMFVNSVNTLAKTVSVTRGYQTPGSAHPHLSGALVFIVQGNAIPYAIKAIAPGGSCTRTQQLYLPVISLTAPGQGLTTISDCVGGVWTAGSFLAQNQAPFRFYFPVPGAVAYTGIGGTGTAPTATGLFCTEIDLPYNFRMTGLGILNGTVVGTDNHTISIYDATGNLLANSAAAGVLAANASTYQNISLTTPYYLVGPALYYGCMQSNGTTATVRMVTAGTQDQILTKLTTGQTFGTFAPTFTVPTTFTTAVGPYFTMF